MAITMTITNDGHNLFRDAAKNTNTALISYVALGSSSTTPTTSDHQLAAEVFRKKVTSYTNGVSVGEVLIALYLAPGDAVGANIEEIGFFGGASASSLANTGVLLARGLYTHNPKSALESIVFSLDFTV